MINEHARLWGNDRVLARGTKHSLDVGKSLDSTRAPHTLDLPGVSGCPGSVVVVVVVGGSGEFH